MIEVDQIVGKLSMKKEAVVAWSKLLEERGLVEYQKSFFGERLRLKYGLTNFREICDYSRQCK